MKPILRRDLLRLGGAAAAAAPCLSWSPLLGASQASDLRSVRITKVRIHPLRQKLKTPISWCCGKDVSSLSTSVVEVRTNQGVTGWGDGMWGDNLLRDHPELVIGRSPFDAEAIFEEMGAHSRNARTPGGLDAAIWDIAGKVTGKPVHELLGRQYRDRIMPYASVGYRKNSWPDLVRGFAEEERHYAHDLGFRALKAKTGYGPELDIEIVAAIREAIGPKVKRGIDSGAPGIYDDGTALGLGRQLERYNLEFWEEPIYQHDVDGYARLRNLLRIPLASGEGVAIDWLIDNYINKKLVDIVQPDINRAGFSGARKINYAAWLNRVRVIPHTWAHTPLRIVATMHWVACVPVEFERYVNPPPCLMELHPPHEAVAWELTEERLEMDKSDGCIPLPEGPGLGVTVIPEVLEKYRYRDVVEIG